MISTMQHETIFAALALSRCSGGPCDSANGNGSDAAQASHSANKPPNDWNAEDACSVINQNQMAALIGQNVTETCLGLLNASDGAIAATSECTYQLAENNTVTVMLRWSPDLPHQGGPPVMLEFWRLWSPCWAT